MTKYVYDVQKLLYISFQLVVFEIRKVPQKSMNTFFNMNDKKRREVKKYYYLLRQKVSLSCV